MKRRGYSIYWPFASSIISSEHKMMESNRIKYPRLRTSLIIREIFPTKFGILPLITIKFFIIKNIHTVLKTIAIFCPLSTQYGWKVLLSIDAAKRAQPKTAIIPVLTMKVVFWPNPVWSSHHFIDKKTNMLGNTK